MFEILKKPVNFTFVVHLLLVFFIAMGAIPRIWAWAVALMLAVFIIRRPLKDSLILFSRSIPFYIALPITSSFDSFNMWRIVTMLIALKWTFIIRKGILSLLKSQRAISAVKSLWEKNKMEFLGLLLLAIFFVSLFKADYLFPGARRLAYFANLSIIFPVIVWTFKKELITIGEISKNIVLALLLVAAVGYLQLMSTYIMNLGEFMAFWANQIQFGFYGTGWSQIVFSANTWFAYNAGASPKLRMFSTFPDSHSFPLYVLMAMPALLTVFWRKMKSPDSGSAQKFAQKYNKTTLGWLALLFLMFLALVLTGTRGIWISVAFPILFYLTLRKFSKNEKYPALRLAKTEEGQKIIKAASASLLLFFLAFGTSYAILSKDQFLFKSEASAERDKLLNRIKSIVDASETSNSARLYIWKESLKSIAKNPFLGVGIGNFPVVLGQNISAQKAGASAHNLYLNILAETGAASLAVFLAICVLALKYAWEIFQAARDPEIKIYAYSFLLYTLWVLGYNLTDAALFDEREFLMFILAFGIIAGIKKSPTYAKQQ